MKLYRKIRFGLFLLSIIAALSCFANEPDFKVLYHNDMWNVVWQAPYMNQGGYQGVSEIGEFIKRSVDETAGGGVDCHIFYPGTLWVPMWDSDVYPITEHAQWFANKYPGETMNNFQQYVLNGGDPVDDFVTRCREKGMSPFIGITLNHNPGSSHQNGSFYEDNPQYKFSVVDGGQPDTQSFAYPEVRQYRLDLIEELCENYGSSA